MSDEEDDDEYEDEPVPGKPAPAPAPADLRAAIADRHLRFGWWGLFLFAGLGLVLESLNGLRVDYYINVANDTRRHMFTLAHAHGTLLSLVNLAFAFTVAAAFGERIRNVKTPSACLLGADPAPRGLLHGRPRDLRRRSWARHRDGARRRVAPDGRRAPRRATLTITPRCSDQRARRRSRRCRW